MEPAGGLLSPAAEEMGREKSVVDILADWLFLY